MYETQGYSGQGNTMPYSFSPAQAASTEVGWSALACSLRSQCSGQAYQRHWQSYASSIPDVSRHASLARPVRYSPQSIAGTYLAPVTHLEPESFLREGRPEMPFQDTLSPALREHIREAFRATTGEDLPDNLSITILNDKEFDEAHKAHDGIPSKSVQGFSINTNGKGTNRIFIRAASLDALLLTIGHEIGHVLAPALSNEADEEAKAFAFSLAWMDAIREKNIAGIASCIVPEPAHNGIHDAGFAFVKELLAQGKTALNAFKELAHGIVSLTKKLEIIVLED